MINKDYLLLLFFTLSLTFFSFAETSLNASDHLAEEVISLSFASPANNTQFSIGQPIGVTINAADSDGSISNVRLFINNTLVRQENFAPYEWGTDNANQNDNAIQNLAAGSYTLTAVATDNVGNTEQTSIAISIGNTGGGEGNLNIDQAFNFATANTNTPAPFIEDTGGAFGARNGLTYGWLLTSNNAPTTASAEVRNRDLNGDPIRESLIHIGRTPNIKWEVAVPNGSYRVVITAGDPNVESTLNTHHIIKAEGVTVIDYMPNSSAGLRTDVANITVSDGRLTIDGNSGINSKLVALAIQSTDILQHPAVIQSTPADGATNVNTGTSISANFIATPNQNNQGLGFIDNSTITSNTVKLFELNGATATEVNATVNGTGFGDAINLTVAGGLKPNTRYLFTVEGVQDILGAVIFPFTSEFVTGTATSNNNTGNLDNVSFTNAGQVATGRYSSLTMGPDGKLYGLRISGQIDRWNINANGTLNGIQTLNGITNAYGGDRLAIGLTFAPNATANNLVAYVSHSTFVFSGGPEYDGKISRLTGANLQNEQLIVNNLPRGLRDHLTNSIVFDPNDPNVLYFNQGSNTPGGFTGGTRPERLITAATLRLDLDLIPSLPLDARCSENINVINNASTNSPFMSDGTYNPYFVNAPLTIYASGVRNAYDLLWHSNGQLYIPTNGTAGGSASPASVQGTRRPNGDLYNGPNIPQISENDVQRDFLFRVNPNDNTVGYYGNPNPMRGEYVLNSGAASTSTYPNNIVADANYRGFAYDFEFNKSPNGVIEYQSAGALQGAIIVCRYSGGSDLIALVPDGPNGDIGTFKEGIPGFGGMRDPLDLVEDTNTGNIYVADLTDEHIILLKPGGNPVSGNSISLSFVSPTNNENFEVGDPIGVTMNTSDANGTISNIQLFLNNTLVRQENSAPWQWGADNANSVDAALQNLATGTYILRAVATDNAGNTEESSISITIGTPSSSGISLSFANPENNDVFAVGDPIGVTMNASNANGSISNIQLFLNNTLVRQENSAPWEWGADNANAVDAALQNLAPGNHTLRAVATDNTGNTEESSISISVISTGTNLGISFASPSNNEVFEFGESVGVTIDATANSGISNIQLFVDNMLVRQENSAPWEWGADNANSVDAALQNLAPGNHTLRAVATDNDGNTEESSISISVISTGTNLGILFASPSNNEVFEFGESVGVTIDATANSGISNIQLFIDNTLVRQENSAPWEWGADNANSVDAALQNLAPGNYTLRAVATDNAGNNEESSINIEVTTNNVGIFVENLRKIPGTDISFPYEDRIVFHAQRFNTLSTEFSSIRIHNTGTALLNISSIDISDDVFELVANADAGNFSIQPGSSRDVMIHFVEDSDVDLNDQEAVLTVNSNAATQPQVSIDLVGNYRLEPTPFRIMETFGFNTDIGQRPLSSSYPTSESIASGVEGDIVVSQLWEQADPNQEINAFIPATFSNGTTSARFINENGSTINGFLATFADPWLRSFYPRTNTDQIDGPISSFSGNLNQPFAIRLASQSTLGFGGINPATGNPNNLGVRVYRVINQDGSVRQNHYYAIFDFAGGNGDCVVNGINRCDWNDVTLYITNIKPVEPLENWDAEVAAPDALNTATCESEGLVTYGDGTITMQGGSAYQVFDKTWSEIFSCYEACGNSQTLNNLSAGQYIVFIKEENGQNICQQVVTLTNGTGGNLDTGEGNSITNRIASPLSSFTTQPKEQQVAIFPNPANEELFINMSSYAGKQGSLYLFDHLGKVLLEQKMGTLTTDLVKMNIEALQNGLYHLVVEVDQQVVFAKKVIVHQVD